MRRIFNSANSIASIVTYFRHIALLTMTLLSTGCAPKLSYDGNLVQVVPGIEAVQCKHLANSQITLSKAQVFFRRTPEKRTEMLLIEARNLAGKIGADHIVPLGKPKENMQIFKFYICKHS